jgi:CheY-like chemotaxis protein
MQCLELLKNNQIPDLILLDIMMPGMNGWDVAAEIRKNPIWNKIPLVFLTAKTNSFSKTFGGIVSEDYITKPFEMKELKESIDKFLDG